MGPVRSVSVYFNANVTGFINGTRRAAGALGGLERRLNTSTGVQRRALDNVGRSATVMGVALAGGFLLGVRESMKFEKQMSAVKAVAGATGAQMQQLSKQALDAGRNTAFGATEAAKGQEELAKAGVKTSDILGGGLKGALDLASAGALGVDEAAETASIAMTQFGLSGKDVPHVADLLAAGANKALGEVHDLSYALRMGGLVANQFDLSVEDTVGTLAAFARGGLIGSDAGTSFKTMLLHLAAPTKKSSELMRDLGIQTYDAQGKFVGITGLADQLQSKLGGLTEKQRNAALSIIFGTDAIRSANILYKEGGAGIQSWINNVDDAGYASKVAGTKLDNLSGDLTKLKGAFSTALIQGGSEATGGLRVLTQGVTGLVNAYSSLPSSAQSTLFAIVGVTGAALLGAKGLIFMVSTVRDAKVALLALGLTSDRVALMMLKVRGALSATASFMAGPWGIAVAAGVYVLTAWYMSKKKATEATEEFTQAIEADSGALGENTRSAVVNELQKQGMLESAKALGLSLYDVTDAVLGNKQAYDRVNASLDATHDRLAQAALDNPQYSESVDHQYDAITKFKKGLEDQNGTLRKAAQEVKLKTEATKRSGEADTSATGATTAATVATVQHTTAEEKLIAVMRDSAKTADDLKKSFDELAGANISADQADLDHARTLAEVAKASDKTAKFTDKERQAMINLALADQSIIEKRKAAGATADQLVAKQRKLYAEFIRQAMIMGRTRREAEGLARDYGIVNVATTAAASGIAGFIGRARDAAGSLQRMGRRSEDAATNTRLYGASIKNSLPVLYALASGNQKATDQVDALARATGNTAGKMGISRNAFLSAASAMNIGTKRAKELWSVLQQMKPKKVPVEVDAVGHWSSMSASRIAQEYGMKRAKGGPIPAIGPESSRAYDSVPALLRVDEHVWTPEEVDAVGGHSAMYRIRALALAGKLKGYATGGAVSNFTRGDSVSRVIEPINTGYQSMLNTIASAFAAAWKQFAGNGGPVVAAARSQIGLPYSWGGGGPSGPSYGIGRGAGTYGFDCSGLSEYAWWQGRHVDIGGTTGPQVANSNPISGPRPGALAFVGNPVHHVMIGSNKPGYVIQAPHTGAFVEEVPRTSSNWRWPQGLAKGGEVTLGERVSAGRASRDEAALGRLLQIAGGAPRGAESHTAQIARGGEMRLWAEPETQGEAYIPLAPSKRLRSKAILSSVARKFGLSVRGMADGGIVGYADGDAPDLNLSDYLSQWNDAVDPATAADVSDAKKAKKTQSDQVATAKRALAKAKQVRDDRIHAAEKRLKRAEASKGKRRAEAIEDAKEALKKAKRTDTIRAAEAKLKKERNDLAAATKKLGDTEKKYQYSKLSPATQLGSALALGIKNTGAFIQHLTTLSDRGFGVLAQQLLKMGGPEAEKIAADAVKMSNSKLSTLQGQVQTATNQQQTLADLPNILTVRSSMKTLGAGASSWIALLKATGLDPGSLAEAVRLMAGDLSKTSTGKALLADMKVHGYRNGGWVTGRTGVDQVPMWGTAGEFVSTRPAATRYGPLLEAINQDRVGDALLRRYIRAEPGRAPRHSAADGGRAPMNFTFNHPEMNASQLAREVAREASWALN